MDIEGTADHSSEWTTMSNDERLEKIEYRSHSNIPNANGFTVILPNIPLDQYRKTREALEGLGVIVKDPSKKNATALAQEPGPIAAWQDKFRGAFI